MIVRRRAGLFLEPLTKNQGHKVTTYLYLVDTLLSCLGLHLPRWIERDDLTHAGILGLIEAVVRFNWDGDHNLFPTYARIRIRGSIQDYLRKLDLSSRYQRRNIRRQEHLLGLMQNQKNWLEVENKVACEAVNLSYETEVDAAEMVDYQDQKNWLYSRLNHLAPLEKKVIYFHYFQDKPFAQLALDLGVSKARVSQIYHQALKHLKKSS